MTLTRWQRPSGWGFAPWRRVTTAPDALDQLFHAVTEAFDLPAASNASAWLPVVDLFETTDNVTVKAELPGMKKDDISISLHDGFLTLSGERKDETTAATADGTRTERVMGRFHRTISIPTKVNADAIKATYTDGILTVVLPKAEEAKPKQIHVSFN